RGLHRSHQGSVIGGVHRILDNVLGGKHLASATMGFFDPATSVVTAMAAIAVIPSNLFFILSSRSDCFAFKGITAGRRSQIAFTRDSMVGRIQASRNFF